MITKNRGRHAAAVMAAACAVSAVISVGLPVAAQAATTSTHDVPAVDIVPVGTTHHDPNQGMWFVFALGRNHSGHGVAQLINPADIAQTVRLYPRELDFTDAGTPSLSPDTRAGIGSWVTFDHPVVTVAAQQRLDVGFTVRIPADAEPGDHTGALVAESQPADIGGRFQILKRIATRFYVTVPGRAVVGYDLRALQTKVDNVLWPGQESTQVSVVNTGNVRFVPDVRFDGRRGIGSDLVLARSVEVFRSSVHVPWYGGPVHIHVTASADGAHPESLDKTVWVIPWGLIAIVLVTLAALVHAWIFMRRRRRRARAEQAALRAELAALQELAATRMSSASQ